MRMRKSQLVAFSHRSSLPIPPVTPIPPSIPAPAFVTFHFNTRRPGTLPFPQKKRKKNNVECNRVRSTRFSPRRRFPLPAARLQPPIAAFSPLAFVLISCSLFCFSYFFWILYFAHRSLASSLARSLAPHWGTEWIMAAGREVEDVETGTGCALVTSQRGHSLFSSGSRSRSRSNMLPTTICGCHICLSPLAAIVHFMSHEIRIYTSIARRSSGAALIVTINQLASVPPLQQPLQRQLQQPL